MVRSAHSGVLATGGARRGVPPYHVDVTRRALLVLISLVMVVTSVGCDHADFAGCHDTTTAPTDCLAWAGFSSIHGLTLVGVDKNKSWHDLVRFALRGSPAAIDQALAAAHFAAPAEMGLTVVDTPLANVHLENLIDIRSATEDGWKNPQGLRLTRHVVRGGTGSAAMDDEIAVWAFVS